MTTIDNTLKRAVESQQIPGCVAIVFDQQSTLYQGAFGVRGNDTKTLMTVDTVFRLASMTKAFTSIAVMQLVEQGQLKLDQPVSDLLPEFAQLKVLTGFYGDKPALRAPARPATLRHLLTHTSGLAYQFWHKHLTRWVEVTKTPALLDSTYAGHS
jgi:methyl acetate hydrolase